MGIFFLEESNPSFKAYIFNKRILKFSLLCALIWPPHDP